MMTEHEMRVAIAEAEGFKRIGLIEGETQLMGDLPPCRGWIPIPDYLNDLNAMHEAEQAIYSSHLTYVRYETILIDMVEHPLRSTAKQRAEAFCKTLFPERFKE